eukprot:RCo051200
MDTSTNVSALTTSETSLLQQPVVPPKPISSVPLGKPISGLSSPADSPYLTISRAQDWSGTTPRSLSRSLELGHGESPAASGLDLAQAYRVEALRRRVLEDEARRTQLLVTELRSEVDSLRRERQRIQDDMGQSLVRAANATASWSTCLAVDAELAVVLEKNRNLENRNRMLAAELERLSSSGAAGALQELLRGEEARRVLAEQEVGQLRERLAALQGQDPRSKARDSNSSAPLPPTEQVRSPRLQPQSPPEMARAVCRAQELETALG